MKPIEKVLIANRGEIACRIARGCREAGIRTVAIFSEADRGALHTRLADEAICVGPGPNTDSYLNLANVLMAVQISGADAVHPGYGYFSERAPFASALLELGVRFIGPPPSAIEAMGDKAAAKAAAIAADCPVVPGSKGAVPDEAAALAAAEEIGFPVLLKAVAGGGGRGIRRVESASELPGLFRTASAEAQASFGSGEMIVEKSVERPRHVEIQVLGDHHGTVVHLGERECSVQNVRHQKILEEAPFEGMTAELRDAMGGAAVRVAEAVGYQNLGTVEFLLDDDGRFYFLEMNTRLQVEHPVTEEVTGHDLIRLQLEVASGRPLPFRQEDLALAGHSIEARVTAQDPDRDFAPATGTISAWRAPMGRGVRMETYCSEGTPVTPYYDPMIAKLVVRAEDRPRAVAKLAVALAEFEVEGVTTNIPFLRRLVAHPDYVAGRVDTGWVGRLLASAVAEAAP